MWPLVMYSNYFKIVLSSLVNQAHLTSVYNTVILYHYTL